MAVLLSIDLGTEGARVGAFDETGDLLAEASHGYPTTFPRPGWAEQDPRDWWSATVTAVRDVLAHDDVRARGSVAGIGVATTASTVAVLDEAAEPLRPALLWMDARAVEESAATAALADRHPVLAWSGGADAVEWLVPKAMWVARNEPETYQRAAHIVEAVDYLTYRLTGSWIGSRLNATCKWNYDPLAGELPDLLYEDLGVPDLAAKLPHDIRRVGDPAGVLCDSAADDLGIVGRPVVATGGIDAHVSLIGCGRSTPGLVSIVAGTSTAFVTEVPEAIYTPTIWGPYPNALRDDQWLIEGGQVSSGSVLRWVSESMLKVTRDDLGALVKAAGHVAPGSHGLLVLDTFMGNRTPYRDARLRGAILGLTLGTTPAELYLAACESVAYGTRAVVDSLDDAGIPVDRLVVSGGIRNNPLWLQVTVDVLGRAIEMVDSDNLTLRAGAACATFAAGAGTLDEAAQRFAPAPRTVEPTSHRLGAYEDGYRRYRRALATTRELVHELADSTEHA